MLNKTVFPPVHIITNYDQPQLDLISYANHFCLKTKFYTLINKDCNMKHVFRRCLTAFSSFEYLNNHKVNCIKQQPTNIDSSYNDKLRFEDYHMKKTGTDKCIDIF